MRFIGEEHLEDLATGAAILGTGGGGDPHVGKLLALSAIRLRGPVGVVGLDEVPDDAFIVPVGMMGAPSVANEKLASLDGLRGAVEAVAAHFGRAATHTMPCEIGGINSLLPIAAAAELGLPVIDADMMGRAFPEIQMVIPTLFGLSASPIAIADEKGNSVVISGISNRWTERIARVVTTEMGASTLLALYAMTGKQARPAVVAGSLALCEDLGRVVREANATHQCPITAAMRRIGGHLLISGKVSDLDRRTEGGFTLSDALVTGLGAAAGSVLRVRSQNEHLLADRDGTLVASTPDLIIVLDSDTGIPITTEAMRYGLRVSVIAAPCDPRFRSQAGIDLVGPRAFGFDVDYLSLPGGDE